MILSLRQKQSLFVRLIADLINHAYAQGFELTFGECWRSPEEAARLASVDKGIAQSLHTQRLAIDLNLFRDGKWLTALEAYRPLGEYWEQQSHVPDYQCSWGGRFKDSQGNLRPDANHFSVAHGGRQ